MKIGFANDNLEKLATDPDYNMGLPDHVAQKYRDRVALIIAVSDERTFRALQGSLDYKKLEGGEDDERQMRLNRQYRIRLKIIETAEGKSIQVTGVGDFH